MTESVVQRNHHTLPYFCAKSSFNHLCTNEFHRMFFVCQKHVLLSRVSGWAVRGFLNWIVTNWKVQWATEGPRFTRINNPGIWSKGQQVIARWTLLGLQAFWCGQIHPNTTNKKKSLKRRGTSEVPAKRNKFNTQDGTDAKVDLACATAHAKR